jgi:hypothetical protein
MLHISRWFVKTQVGDSKRINSSASLNFLSRSLMVLYYQGLSQVLSKFVTQPSHMQSFETTKIPRGAESSEQSGGEQDRIIARAQ